MQTPGHHVCRCCITTPTPKNAEDFFQQQMPSHCLASLLFYDRSSIATRILHCIISHLITPQKIPGVGSNFDGMSRSELAPLNMDDPVPNIFMISKMEASDFIESKTLPTTHLCFWQFTIFYARNHLAVFWCPELETSTTHSTQRSPVTPSDLDPSSNLHSWFFRELVSMATWTRGVFVLGSFHLFCGG